MNMHQTGTQINHYISRITCSETSETSKFLSYFPPTVMLQIYKKNSNHFFFVFEKITSWVSY